MAALYCVSRCTPLKQRRRHACGAHWSTPTRRRRGAVHETRAQETAANGAHVTHDEEVTTTTTARESLRDVYVRIHHVAIIVESLERTLAFYEDVLGFTRDESRPNDKLPFRGVFLRVGAEPEDEQAAGGPQAQTIHVMELANPDPMEVRGVCHVALIASVVVFVAWGMDSIEVLHICIGPYA